MNVLIVALDAVIPAEVPDGDVLVVAPALNSPLRHWLSDEDGARRRARERVAAFVERLDRNGIRAEGRVGDADPLLAIADALRTFPADEIVIAARADRPARLAEELVSRARECFALPVCHTGAGLIEADVREPGASARTLVAGSNRPRAAARAAPSEAV
jgi:nucleotide-binding universal stress UspA family protein